MTDLFVTRFTDDTWEENRRYCINKSLDIYNSPVLFSKAIPYNTNIIVFEMNNSINKIMGISVVRNKVRGTHQHKIHSDNNYNRYSYFVKSRITLDMMTESELQIVRFVENICFVGKTHMKRGQGVSKINNKNFTKCNNILDIPLFIRNMIMSRKKKEKDVEKSVENSVEKSVEKDVERRVERSVENKKIVFKLKMNKHY